MSLRFGNSFHTTVRLRGLISGLVGNLVSLFFMFLKNLRKGPEQIRKVKIVQVVPHT